MNIDSDISDLSSNAVLNPTFHDVEIKLVEIINPSTSTVKFKDHGDHKEGYKHANSNISGDYNHDKAFEDANGTSRLDLALDQSQGDKLEKSAVQFSDHVMTQGAGGFPLHVTSYPRDSNQDCMEERDVGEQPVNRTAKLKHKEELQHKQQVLMESFSREGRHHSGKKREPSAKFYEVAPGILVADRPVYRTSPNMTTVQQEMFYQPNQNVIQSNRAATVPGSRKARVWTGHRSSNSRAVSTVSSRWKMEELAPPKPNHFIKMPFKQMPIVTMDSKIKTQDELFLPGDEMRATTAFALSRIRHAFRRMAPPSRLDSRQGRLLKARLRPMRPVKVKGPNIASCHGVQPEERKQRTDSPDPERLRELKQQYLEACKMHRGDHVQDEIKRRRDAHSATSEQSVHRNSPEPNDFETSPKDLYPINQGLFFTEKEIRNGVGQEFYEEFARETDQFGVISNKMASLRMDSSVIF